MMRMIKNWLADETTVGVTRKKTGTRKAVTVNHELFYRITMIILITAGILYMLFGELHV